MLLAISRSGNGLMLRKQYFAKSVKESCQTFSEFFSENPMRFLYTHHFIWIHHSSVLIYQKILSNFFHICESSIVCIPQPDYYLPFCALFSEAPYNYLSFCPKPSPWKVSSQYRNGSNGFPRIEYGDSRYFADISRAEAPPRLYLRSVKLSIMAS